MDKSTIPFNIPLVLGSESKYVQDAIKRGEFSGGGHYSSLCERELERITKTNVLLTSSCTHALEMAALLIDISEGDEIIMSSYNFVSAANAFVLRGAKIVFVDIRTDTLNIDEKLIEESISSKTKAIVAMHYGGVPCEMDYILALAEKYNLYVVEDAAHSIDSYYKERHLGSIGHIGTLSFHATKNIQCGEGGAILINDKKLLDRAYKIRDKGTNRRNFLEGKVDKYTWVDIGSSYQMSELTAAFLYSQIMNVKDISLERIKLCTFYKESLSSSVLSVAKNIGNGHIFYVQYRNIEERNSKIRDMKAKGVSVSFHYIPLHSSQAGINYSATVRKLKYTTDVASKILRLPLYIGLNKSQQYRIVKMLDL